MAGWTSYPSRSRAPTIAELLDYGGRPLYSFEFFPPKDEVQQRQLWKAIRELESLGPDFVSVTYGASGSTRERTIRATEAIAQHTTLRAVAHLTCTSQSREQIRQVIGSYAAAGIRHILAIRGDMPGGPRVPWMRHPDGLSNATELVTMVRELGDFCVGVAAFPEPHPEHGDAALHARRLFPPRRASAVAGLRHSHSAGNHADHERLAGEAVRGAIRRCAADQGDRQDRRRGGRRGPGAKGGNRNRHRTLRGAARRRCARSALLHAEPFPRYSRDLRQSPADPTSSVTRR